LCIKWSVWSKCSISTVRELNPEHLTVEKQPIVWETERRQVIEEIQPVVYKETIVPTLIKETKPVYQKVVEGTTYQSEVMAPRTINISQNNTELNRAELSRAPVMQSTHSHIDLPVQYVERPATVHEEIRQEYVEEIQPIINVEKFRTEVIQKTQPLTDKEVRSVMVQERTLPREIMPEVVNRSVQFPTAMEYNTVRDLGSQNVVVEKAAIYNETERRQVIEEIQPVIYKETIVPTLIRETKPIYQRVIEPTTYVQQTLAPMPLSSSGYHVQPGTNAPFNAQTNPQFQQSLTNSGNTAFGPNAPFNAQTNPQFQQSLTNSGNTAFGQSGLNRSGVMEEKTTQTTSTTTANQPLPPL